MSLNDSLFFICPYMWVVRVWTVWNYLIPSHIFRVGVVAYYNLVLLSVHHSRIITWHLLIHERDKIWGTIFIQCYGHYSFQGSRPLSSVFLNFYLILITMISSRYLTSTKHLRASPSGEALPSGRIIMEIYK